MTRLGAPLRAALVGLALTCHPVGLRRRGDVRGATTPPASASSCADLQKLANLMDAVMREAVTRDDWVTFAQGRLDYATLIAEDNGQCWSQSLADRMRAELPALQADVDAAGRGATIEGLS